MRERHRPEQTTLYRLVQQHAASFIAHAEAGSGAELPPGRCRAQGRRRAQWRRHADPAPWVGRQHRMGDFGDLFLDDARKADRLLDIMLTTRGQRDRIGGIWRTVPIDAVRRTGPAPEALKWHRHRRCR